MSESKKNVNSIVWMLGVGIAFVLWKLTDNIWLSIGIVVIVVLPVMTVIGNMIAGANRRANTSVGRGNSGNRQAVIKSETDSGAEDIFCRYDKIMSFIDDMAAARSDGKWGYIDRNGTELIPCRYDEVDALFRNGMAAVKSDGKWGYIDRNGTEVIPCRYDEVDAFRKDMAVVKSGDKYGYIDKSGTEVVPCRYDEIKSFHDGMARVLYDGKYGYMDDSGAEAISCRYDNAYAFDKGIAAVKSNGKQMYIDKKGNEYPTEKKARKALEEAGSNR
ncbi:MAG: WG repeat-containing protein [Tannerellaceae bacterium]|jgi:hypothetical protein|nr:WG repeat-containing protein [Tannerellaceae bacterium]